MRKNLRAPTIDRLRCRRGFPLSLLIAAMLFGMACEETTPTVLETENGTQTSDQTSDQSNESGNGSDGSANDGESDAGESDAGEANDNDVLSGEPDGMTDGTQPDDQEPEPNPQDSGAQPDPDGPPATTKSQMSYIFVAHPDDEIAAWSTIENSSGNYHVFVLLTRGGHTNHCENPVNKPGMDQYPPTPRGSEACKENRITSWHKFLNRAAATDPFLDNLPADTPDVSDVDASAGRFDVWVGENSARVVFDFPDGGLQSQNLVTANELVRSMKGSLLPDLPDYQAMAGSFWNANYPDCAIYEHADHRAVHVGVYDNDLDTTIQRGRTCATDPDAIYFREISASTWRTLAGSPDFLENGGDPGIYRQSYGWLWGAWEMSEDESTLISRQQSFWQRSF